MSSLSIDSQFAQFVAFAQKEIGDGKKTAVARLVGDATLGGHTIKRAVGDHVGALKRSSLNRAANNQTRQLFANVVFELFGGASKVPKNVFKALDLGNLDTGKPLTARRIAAVAKAVEANRSKAFVAGLPDTLEVPVGNGTVTFEKRHYEKLVAAIPAKECPKTAEEVVRLLADRIENGRAIIRDVLEGRAAFHAASTNKVADVTLALYAAALRNGEKIHNGAFSVQDPEGRLAKWLDTCPYVYVRASSHLKAYQDLTVDGHLNRLRGIDVEPGRNGLLSGMRTVHFGTIPDLDHLEDAGGNGPCRRLYVKCESHGAPHSAILDGTVAKSLSKGMTVRPAQKGDWPESIRHALSFIKTRGINPASGGARRESMTAGVKAAYKRLVEELKVSGRKDLAKIIDPGNVKQGGASLLLRNLATALETAPNDQVLTRGSLEIAEALNADASNLRGHQYLRLGNEVMLEASDF